MKILFVYTNINVRGASFGRYPAMQLGLASISAVLKKHGHECRLLLAEQANFEEAVGHAVTTFQPELAAFTAVTTQFPYVKRIAQQLRERAPRVFQVCGGPHATLVPEKVLRESPIDAVCVGEGEYPVLELAESLATGHCCTAIKNLYFKSSDGSIIRNEIRPLIENLDELPFFDRELFRDYIDLGRYPHSVLTTRGCYFECTYCCNHSFKRIAPGHYVRSRSVAHILSEIEYLRSCYPGLSHLYIEDETIGQNKKLWDKLLPELKKTGLRYSSNFRIGVAGNDFLEGMRDANFRKVNMGVESGNEWLRKNVLKRHYSNEQIIAAYRHAKKLGMKTKSYNLIGLPHETPEMFEDTIRVNRIIRPDETALNIFFPYPGTELDRLCDEMGVKPKEADVPIRERTQSILDLPDFPRNKIMAYFEAWGLMMRFGRVGYYVRPLKQLKQAMLRKRHQSSSQ